MAVKATTHTTACGQLLLSANAFHGLHATLAGPARLTNSDSLHCGRVRDDWVASGNLADFARMSAVHEMTDANMPARFT